MLVNLRYTVGRLSAVAARPLCLFLANNYLSQGTAASLAITILATSLALTLIAADTHRRYYVREFEVEKRSNYLLFYVYVTSLLLLSMLGAVFVLVVVYYFTKSAEVAAVATLYFAGEKLADELLRHKLFERAFTSWGSAATARGLLQVSGVLIAVMLGGHNVPAALIILILAASALTVFLPGTPVRLLRKFVSMRLSTIAHLARRAIAAMWNGWMLWVIAVLGASVAYVDRIVALMVAKPLLPLFTLVVMAFSVLQMSVDFYYVSAHRTSFLQGRISIKRVFTSGSFLGSLLGGFAVGGVCCAVLLLLSKNGPDFPIAYVLAIALLQVSAALTAAPFQILYWRGELRRILLTEVGFWLLLLALVTLVKALGGSPAAMFAAVVGCALFRLTLYIVELPAATKMVEARS